MNSIQVTNDDISQKKELYVISPYKIWMIILKYGGYGFKKHIKRRVKT